MATPSKLNSLVKPHEFERADRLERLYMYRLEQTKCKLNEREQRHFYRLRYAAMLFIDPKKTSKDIVSILQCDLGIKQESARTLLAQLPVVYPDLIENSRLLEKHDVAAKLHKLIERCEERDSTYDDEVAIKAKKLLSDIRQWGKEDLGIKKGDIQLPQPMWTDDPSVLENDNGTDEAEDAEYEELDSDNPTANKEVDDEG